eukprot:gene10220-12534_t
MTSLLDDEDEVIQNPDSIITSISTTSTTTTTTTPQPQQQQQQIGKPSLVNSNNVVGGATFQLIEDDNEELLTGSSSSTTSSSHYSVASVPITEPKSNINGIVLGRRVSSASKHPYNPSSSLVSSTSSLSSSTENTLSSSQNIVVPVQSHQSQQPLTSSSTSSVSAPSTPIKNRLNISNEVLQTPSSPMSPPKPNSNLLAKLQTISPPKSPVQSLIPEVEDLHNSSNQILTTTKHKRVKSADLNNSETIESNHKANGITTTTTTTTSSSSSNSSIHGGRTLPAPLVQSKSLPISPIHHFEPMGSPGLSARSHNVISAPVSSGNSSQSNSNFTSPSSSPQFIRDGSQTMITPLNLSSPDQASGPKRKGSFSSTSKKANINNFNRSPLLSSNGVSKSSTGGGSGPGDRVMQFLGKMSLSKERMGKLVSQSKEAHKGLNGGATMGSLNKEKEALVTTPFEGIFGIPLRVILRYQTEMGNQIPSILNSIFSILESISSLSTSKLFSTTVPRGEIEQLKTQYDSNQEVNLKNLDPHVITELLLEFFNQLPEPIISIEFYETLLNYYQTETLLHLMIRKMNNPNKSILCRLMKYLKDVLVYSNFNECTMNILVEKFHKYILRPSLGFISQVQISDTHSSTIKDIVSMFIQQADVLFQSPEERSNTEDQLVLYIEEVAATQKTTSNGNMWLFQKQIVWKPKVNPNGEQQDLVILFSSILKVVLAPTTNNKKDQKMLPNLTVYCSSDTKTVITFGFQNPATCKLIYSFINSITKSITPNTRILSQKLDMFSLELESLPNEIKQLKNLQELNLNRNKFKLIPGDLARLSSLKTISIEENNLTEISPEMADFIGTRLPHLENVSFSSNKLVSLPPLYTWVKLKTLNISNNNLTKLPIDIFQIPTLEVLRVSNNNIDDNGIPKLITSTRLRQLDLRKNHLTTIPEGIINLVELQVLTLQDNQISNLTSDIQKLTSLTELNLNGNQITILPPQLLLLTNLKKLYLDNNQIQTISSAIHRMQSLIELRLTNNNISRIPPGIVALKKLVSLELTGNKPLKDYIPEKSIAKGKEGIFSYFSETMRTNVPCYRTRIIVIGEKSTGKSNLIKCLKKMPKSSFSGSTSASSSTLAQHTTNVLDIQDWQCSVNIEGPEGKKKKQITIHLWEFEGMKNEISHVFFVPNITYMVTFNIAQYTIGNDQKLTTYLHSIYLHDRKAVILLVGTHLDESSRKHAEKSVDHLSSKFRSLFPTFQISVHAVSCLKAEGDGIRKLRRDIKSNVSKNPMLKQTYPASFMFLEDYLREESILMSPPLVTKKNLQQMARTMELHNEPHFSQLKSLFNSLGSITSFEQFIRMEPGASPMKTEMISLNPIWIAKAIASLVCFNPYNLPSIVHIAGESAKEEDETIPGILPHHVLRYVWGTNSQYYVPERFFSLFLSLLESKDLAINIYTIDGKDNQILEEELSPTNRRFSTMKMVKFTVSQKVRNGRSGSFNAKSGWSLVSSLLPQLSKPLPVPFEFPNVWEPYPERQEIYQYTRRFVLDFIPNGLFGRFLSRLMQVSHLLRCWHNIAILVPDSTKKSLNERILITLDPETNTIDITNRFIKPTNLAFQIYGIFESLITKWYRVTYKTLVACSHCVSNKLQNPHYFNVEDCETAIFRGEKSVYCPHTSQPHSTSRSQIAPLLNGNESPSLSHKLTPKLSRKDSKQIQMSSEAIPSRKDSKNSFFDRKESSSSLHSSTSSLASSVNNSSSNLDPNTTPVGIRTILLDHHLLCEWIKEIDFREIEVQPDQSQSENGSVSESMGMYANQFVNIKIFNQPSSESHLPHQCSKILSAFRHEALAHTMFKHPNVLSIIGISLNPIAIITENPTFGNQGSTVLSEYIQDRQKNPEIPWNIKLKIALDIARAMDLLQSQSPPFLLTSLSSTTIVLEKSSKTGEEGIVAKIRDFSSSSPLPSLFPTDTSAKSWHAPEVLQKLNYHEQTDVYSYGIILYELLTRSVAFQDQERFSNMVINGQRPSIPPDCLPSYADLIKDCWSGEPLNRPTFGDIIYQLQQIKKEIESKENNYKSLASDTNIYSNMPLPSGGSVIYQDKIIHFGGWNGTSKPHSNVYALNLSNMIFEEKLTVVLSNKNSPTYKAFQCHMQAEFNEENLIFYEAIKTFKNLPNQTPEDRDLIKQQSKKIYQAFIGDNAPKEINLPFALKKDLKKKIDHPDGPSVTVFNDTLSFVISSIDDSFHRFKFSAPSQSKNGWVMMNCRGVPPPPMVGHSSLLWNNHLVVVGGWYDGARQLNQIYLLNLESFEWSQHTCTGDIPPSSSGAMNTSLHGDYLLVYYERADSPKQQIFRLSLDSFVCDDEDENENQIKNNNSLTCTNNKTTTTTTTTTKTYNNNKPVNRSKAQEERRLHLARIHENRINNLDKNNDQPIVNNVSLTPNKTTSTITTTTTPNNNNNNINHNKKPFDYAGSSSLRNQLEDIRRNKHQDYRKDKFESNSKRVFTLHDIEELRKQEHELKASFTPHPSTSTSTSNKSKFGTISSIRNELLDPVKIGVKSLELTNKFRNSMGLPSLLWSDGLMELGIEHSKNMAEGKEPFGHGGFDYRVRRFPFFSTRASGENVAMSSGSAEVAEIAVDGWIKSPGHRKNLLGNFNYCAIGVYRLGDSFYLTQLFALA